MSSDLRFFSKCTTTRRGFQLIEFTDGNLEPCELQQSSAFDDSEEGQHNPGSSYVWLGLVGCYTRMHLHRDHVRELIRVLQGWVNDGRLYTE